jgi:cell division protein FtsL
MSNQEKEQPRINQTRRMLNRWSLFGLIVLCAMATALYVRNVVKVNRMLVDIRLLEKTRDSLINQNQALQTRMLTLQSADRITRIARQNLGMMPNPRAPQRVQQ